MKFELSDINGYKPSEPIDMVISLHACDIATDFALYNAITWNASIVLSVPCCQHDISKQMHSEQFSLFERYGIIQERMGALMTDSIRGNLLTYCGYKTQLLEFVDLSLTPKNILIRAVRTNISKEAKLKAYQEVENIVQTFSLSPKLYELLNNDLF